MEDPSRLCFKNELQRLARRRVHESGFAYKKKGSRSKEFGNNSNDTSRPKRDKISQETRQKRVSQIQEDMKEVNMQLDYATKQRERCANVNNFGQALDVSKEMDELRKKRKYQEELALLQKKEALCKRVKKCTSNKTMTQTMKKGNLYQFLQRNDAQIITGSDESITVGNEEPMDFGCDDPIYYGCE